MSELERSEQRTYIKRQKVTGRSPKQIIKYCEDKINESKCYKEIAKLTRVMTLAKSNFKIIENTTHNYNLRQKIMKSAKLSELQKESKQKHQSVRAEEKQKIAEKKTAEKNHISHNKMIKELKPRLGELYQIREELIKTIKNYPEKANECEKALTEIEEQIKERRKELHAHTTN